MSNSNRTLTIPGKEHPHILEGLECSEITVFYKADCGWLEEDYSWDEEANDFHLTRRERLNNEIKKKWEDYFRKRDDADLAAGRRPLLRPDLSVYEDLIEDEWSPMNTGKAHWLRLELRDWKRNREAGGYDIRLIEGAIAVCEAYIQRRPVDHEC